MMTSKPPTSRADQLRMALATSANPNGGPPVAGALFKALANAGQPAGAGLPTVLDLLDTCKRAIADFGPDCFDRGPRDIVATDPLSARFRSAPPADAARVLRSFANSGESQGFAERYSSQLAVVLVTDLGDWPALMAEPGMAAILQRPSGIPNLQPGDTPVLPAAPRRRARP
jgi:hypothetical protein